MVYSIGVHVPSVPRLKCLDVNSHHIRNWHGIYKLYAIYCLSLE